MDRDPGRTLRHSPMLSLALAVLAGAAAGAARAGEPPLGVSDYEVEGVKVVLQSVRRMSDGTLTVKWEYRNETREPRKLGESFEGMGSSEAYSLSWHAYLADGATRTKFPLAKDPRGTPVAGAHAPGKVVVLGPRKTLSTWAKFLGVPERTRVISVFIPGCQPFEDVPIGR